MTITLTGATGFLGRRLVERLRTEGHELRILARNPSAGESGVRYFAWTAGEGEPPAEALDSADAVIHLAGEPVAQRWNDEAKRRIRDSRVDGTRQLVHALSTQTRRPSTLIVASAIGFYGDRGDETLTEKSRPGTGFLAEVSREWEQQADLAESLGIRVVKVRIGVVLGPEGGAFPKMLPPFRFGLGGRFGSGRQWMSWIHADDLTNLFVAALTDAKWQGAVNGTAPNPVRNAEFTTAMGTALHRPAALIVPKLALKLMLGEMSSAVLGSQRVLPEVARSRHFTFHFPELATALQDIVASPMLK